ncbi:primosomal protein N' [Candidatus Falkowbacteria bacterium CG10_big_fil_rev_8_21_14_0_10_43_10]|uniref:Replication restart protein PriA n=1 Tax=Candidatus Falkowbacteria bacterium CG10_big_fil_rev_8_21_14_0_10_43_10 TaxID=1974567 RepID=A0A2H0V2X7_9BACT|nr:MAG: primosomal protein N' [Candidatus Falkowbacteria bacterium CG10_big_fil_rev_8_21_14_0_10_43_10]
MYANIIPLTRLPLSRPQIYTYELGDLAKEIKIGQLVEIPLYYRSLPGIVVKITAEAPAGIEFKQVNKIIDQHPLVGQREIKLVEFVSEYYYASPGLILKQLAPEPPKKRIKKVEEALVKINLSVIAGGTSINIGEREESCDNSVHTVKKNGDIKLIINTPTPRRQEYLKIISQALQNKKQALFLVPELSLIPQTQEWLEKHFFNEEIVLLHGGLSKTDAYINWRRAQSGGAKIFLGTRHAVLTPFCNLGSIIVDEEQNLSYKQWDMNPRYDARTVAGEKARLYGCDLIFGATAPSVGAYFTSPLPASLREALQASPTPGPLLSKEKGGDIHFVQALLFRKEENKTESTPPLTKEGARGVIIDMRDELRKGNYSIFSEKLQISITEILREKRQAMLFVNRRGSSTFVMCRDCGHIMRCPNCHNALMEHTGRTLSCNRCSYKAASPLTCPKCRSPRIKGFGTGVEKVEQEAKNLFPGARTSRLDIGNAPRLKELRQKYEEFSAGKIDILIGTQTALPLSSPNLSLIAAVNIDSILNFPDWRTDEKSWQMLNQLCRRDDINNCIIQTYNQENRLLRLLARNNLDEFYQQELKNRQALKYPPYIKMIKLICKSDDYNYLQKESAAMADKLRKGLPDAEIIGPVKPVNEKIRNFWQRNIIIKLTESQKNDMLKQILVNLSNAWSIDVDPLT